MKETERRDAPWWERGLKWIARLDYRLERMMIYRDPRKYWEKRGGETYFREQEKYLSRTERSDFITDEIAKLQVSNMLEVGCGYGKQLRSLRKKTTAGLAGVDFSHAQLKKAKDLGVDGILLQEADARDLPFGDKTFDLVFSSAVILHHSRQNAAKILSEMIRVSRKYIVHNEDTNVSSTRFGYDLSRVYGRLGFEIIRCCKIMSAANPDNTQFLIVRIPSEGKNPVTVDAITSFLKN